MTVPQTPDLTLLLNRMLRGDQKAGDEAMDVLYASLRRVASSQMRRERPGHLLDTTALVNEALVRLFGSGTFLVQNRQHFFSMVCLLMKRILIDAGRRKDPAFTSLEESMATLDAPDRERLLTIDGILDRFAYLDPQAYKAFQLQVAAGMTGEEIALEMACSVGTVKRALRRARLWLYKEMHALVGPA